MAKILGVGIAALDIINYVDGFPTEDSEVRAVKQRLVRGGNVTNSLVVLSQLGHECEWAGMMAAERDAEPIKQDLALYQVGTGHCSVVANGKVPTSYVTLNSLNGSRTIVHYRDLPEFSFKQFKTIDLSSFDWVHFEGRNVAETEKMMARVRLNHPDLPISVEIEKVRPGDETRLFPMADVLLFAKAYAQKRGFEKPEAFLTSQKIDGDVFLSWGDQGAYGLAKNSRDICFSAAVPPAKLIDTLGAGDTFNAAVIDGLIRSKTVSECLRGACELAGKKCGVLGFNLH